MGQFLKYILARQRELGDFFRQIALRGFPSVHLLERAAVNSSKLANDARVVVFADALGRFGVPVLIPYGNRDPAPGNQARSRNRASC